MGLDVTVLVCVDDVVGVIVDWVLETVEFEACSIEITCRKFVPLSSVSHAGTIVAWARFGVLSAERKVTESRMNIAMLCERFNPAHVTRFLYGPPELLILHTVAAIQTNFHTLRYGFCEFVASQPPYRLRYVVSTIDDAPKLDYKHYEESVSDASPALKTTAMFATLVNEEPSDGLTG